MRLNNVTANVKSQLKILSLLEIPPYGGQVIV